MAGPTVATVGVLAKTPEGSEYDVIRVKAIAISAASGAQQIVVGVANKKLRVLAIVLVSDTASALTLQDDQGTPKVLLGAMTVPANGGFSHNAMPGFIGETGSGDDLDLNVGTTATIGGYVQYVEV